MITGHKKYLIARCRERGYTLDQVMPCVVSQDGDMWTVDETHKAYPYPRQNKPLERGPGTELKKLLKKWLGIKASPNCSCNARARKMDEEEHREPGWCEKHIDEIVGWLREEATRRKLPFVNTAGKILVRRAIKNAKKNAID